MMYCTKIGFWGAFMETFGSIAGIVAALALGVACYYAVLKLVKWFEV